MTDDELIEQIRSGDEESADVLIRRYYTKILRYCTWHCIDTGQAEDLTQETFFKLFKNLHQYTKKNQFRAYLYTIARNLCIDEQQKRLFSVPLEEDLPQDCTQLQQIEDRQEVQFLLDKLTMEQREAVLLRYVDEMSYGEIARITGCNLRTAQSRVHLGLKIMRKARTYER